MIAALYSADGRFQRSVVIPHAADTRGDVMIFLGPNRWRKGPPETWMIVDRHQGIRYRLTGRVGEDALYREEP